MGEKKIFFWKIQITFWHGRTKLPSRKFAREGELSNICDFYRHLLINKNLWLIKNWLFFLLVKQKQSTGASATPFKLFVPLKMEYKFDIDMLVIKTSCCFLIKKNCSSFASIYTAQQFTKRHFNHVKIWILEFKIHGPSSWIKPRLVLQFKQKYCTRLTHTLNKVTKICHFNL